MQLEFIKYIESELKLYKRYIAILSELESVGLSAQKLSEVPRSVTNKFHSLTETLALWKEDEEHLKESIARIEKWLRYLNWQERHVIKGFYIEDYTYLKISKEWEREEGIHYTEKFWKNVKKRSLTKLKDFYLTEVCKAPLEKIMEYLKLNELQ